MVRKFKHKTLPLTAEMDSNKIFYLILDSNKNPVESIARKDLIELSQEWQEITEPQLVEGPILVTEDGYEIYSYHTTLKEVAEDFEILPIDPDDASKNPVFYGIENAKAYIERHKPRYNIEDLLYLRQEVRSAFFLYGIEEEIKDAILQTINDVKNSKND